MSRLPSRPPPVGARFGRMVVTGAGRTPGGRIGWTLRCDCGEDTVLVPRVVECGITVSCGCAARGPRLRWRRAEESLGERFGMLVVLEILGRTNHGPHVRVRCDCGVETVALLGNLRSGMSTSCGCQRDAANRTHGRSDTPEYHVWCALIRRCEDSDDPAFRYYGGRGIAVCDRWRGSFEAFLEDMGLRPSDAHSIDRVDVNGGYFAANCRWATAREQARNTRRNNWLEIDGAKRLASDVCAEHGVTRQTFFNRVRAGMSPLEAATKPVNPARKRGGLAVASPERRREIARAGQDAARGKPRRSLREHVAAHAGAA